MHEMYNRPVFVPNGENRRDTAILLTGTAEEYGIDMRSILVRPSGFFITEALADAVYGDEDRPAQPDAAVAQEDLTRADQVPEDRGVIEDVPPYDEWEYNDLKVEVATRSLETEDQKKDTLIAALAADDVAQVESE